MPRIIVSVSNDLQTDQRVKKVCETLYNEGFEIILVGRMLKKSTPLERPYAIKRMRLIFNKGPMFYAELNFRLFFYLLFKKADILLSNDLDTLIANFFAAELRNKKLVYDSHEYFTEVPELEGRNAKRVWIQLEKFIFPKLRNVYTVGENLANIYSAKYKVKVDFIRNLPRKEKFDKSEGEYLIYQGAMNKGRGLMELIEAMKEIDIPLKMIGDGDIKDDLRMAIKKKGLEDKIEMIDRVDPEALKEFTKNALIGFNLLEAKSLNYVYSLANKFFDLIQFEVPVVTMQFPEYEAIFEKYEVGVMIKELTAENIRNAVKELLKNDGNEKVRSDLKLAKEEFIWEKEEERLIKIFTQLEE